MVKNLPQLSGWSDCERCERYRTRLGVCARVWPNGAKVLLLGVASSRGSQVSETEEPRLLRWAEAIRAELLMGTRTRGYSVKFTGEERA